MRFWKKKQTPENKFIFEEEDFDRWRLSETLRSFIADFKSRNPVWQIKIVIRTICWMALFVLFFYGTVQKIMG